MHQFLDVDGGVTILHHALGDEDRVLEVVAVPRHERDQHVLAQRQFADVRRGTVGQGIALGATSPTFTSGRWLMQVFWLERVYLVSV